MRNLTELAEKGNLRARLAIDIFCYRIKKYIGAYAAILDKLDAVVFTGGIGENAAELRQQVCTGLDRIGVDLDTEINKKTVGREGDISTKASTVKILVIPTNEELAIANDTFNLAEQG